MTLKENTVLRRIMQTTGGATPLMYACQQCRENEVLDILIQQPYKVKDRDRTAKTPLHYCAENGSTSCAEAILKIAPELVNAQDENGYCTLHLAVIAGNKPLIKLLIQKGADINIYDNEGHSAVHWAIVSSEKEALEMIIRAGANPSTPDIHGGYPLHYAVQICGSNYDYIINPGDTVKVVETLLNFGVDVNVKDKDGRQPILWAASAGSAEAIIHLISAGACVEAADKDGLTALHCAASRGHTSTLETLITLCGANVDVIDANGCSALFYAVTLGHADASELLLQLGAEPNRQDRKGRTPAHCGAAKGQLETLKILQKHGGNLWLRNVKGDFPLHEAVASGRKDLVLWLLSQNPEAVNVANNDGRCLIHIASMYNNTEMVKVLLDSKSLVNPVMRMSKGVLMTPLNVALSKGHRSCGKFLQLHGGVPFSKVSKVETNVAYAVQITPSHDVMNKSVKLSARTVTPSPEKNSTHKTSTDGQTLQSADKKKIYRRRKKRKTNLTVEKGSESDTDDSRSDSRVMNVENQRSGRSNQHSEEDEDDEKKVYLDVRKIEKGKREKSVKMSDEVPEIKKRSLIEKKEVMEEKIEAKKVERKVGAKQLQKNKSFSETKNVSDLSPEDFPPMMQTIEQLDTVMAEPEVSISKNSDETTADIRSNINLIDASYSEAKEIENSVINDTQNLNGHIKDFTQMERQKDDVKDKENESTGKESLNEGKKNGKSSKVAANKRFNGGNKKDEKSPKSSGSKTSADEINVKKTEKQVKSSGSKYSSDGSSHRKSDNSGKPGTSVSSDGSADGIESKSKKVGNLKTSRNATPEKKDGKLTPPSAVKEEVKAQFEENKPKSPAEKPPQESEVDLILVEEKPSEISGNGKKVVESQSVPLDEAVLEENKGPDVKVDEGNIGVESETPQNVTIKLTEEPSENITETEIQTPQNDEKLKNEVHVQEEQSGIPEDDSFLAQKQTISEVSIPQDQTLTNELSYVSPKETNEPDPILFKTDPSGPTTKEENLTEGSDANLVSKGEETSKMEVESSKIVTENTENGLTPMEREKESITVDASSVQDKLNVEKEKKLNAGGIGEIKVVVEEIPMEIGASDEALKASVLPEKKLSDSEDIKNKNLDASGVNFIETLESPQHFLEPHVRFEKKNKAEPESIQNANEETMGSSEVNISDEKTLKLDLKKEYSDMQSDENPEIAKNEENSVAEESHDQHFKETNEWMNSGKRHYRPPRVPRLCRRHRDLHGDANQISVTQLVQNTIRKYHMERGIFYQLLELKRMQIRAGRANEQVLVKRLADEYERSIATMGMKHFSGLYKFREFEKFLYDQLKSLNKNHNLILSEIKSYDDIDALSGILKKTRYKIFSEIPQPDRFCTCITQRCHHSACAYTSVPCSTYISNLRRHKSHKPRKECFLPRIDQSPTKSERRKFDESPATLELIQGNEKRVITLPQNFPDKSKKYYVTFTIKSSPSLRDEELLEEAKHFFKHRHAKSV